MYKVFIVLREGLVHLRHFFLILPFVWSSMSWAFLSDILEAKKQVEGFAISLKSLTDTLDDMGGFKDVEKEYRTYEKELKEFRRTMDEYEELGVDVRDFTEYRNYNPNTLSGQIDFFRNYIKRTHDLIKSFQSLLGSPETITASEQIETNRTLRALLEDSQTRELRRLRREIASQKVLLERKKKEKEFINKQYAYINRHSRKKGFGVFHPFQNSHDRKKKGKRKKFLGIF